MKQVEVFQYLEAKEQVVKDFKMEWDAYRFLLGGKMFAMIGYNKESQPILTLKLPPQEGASYREYDPDLITPGYYMNKVHWISVRYEEAQQDLLESLMDKAYDCGKSALPKKLQKTIFSQ